jgi:hypothetical protein
MTINSTQSRKSYSGNGVTTSFPFPYPFLADADLVAVLTKTDGTFVTKTLTTDYTVTGAGTADSGNVDMIVPPAIGESLVIYRDPAATQLTHWVDNDALPADTLENAFDKLTTIAQRVKDLVTRSIRLDDGDPTTGGITLPSAAVRANKLLAFDGSGNLIVSAPVAGTATALAADLADGVTAGKGASMIGYLGATLSSFLSGVRLQAGDLTIDAGKKIIFEGTTDDANGVMIDPGDPTADRTLTLPDKSGTLATTGDIVIPRNYFSPGGFAPSTAGSSATLTVGAGQCADSTNAVLITLLSAIAKTTSTWAPGSGNGGLDAGTIANNTTYHWYGIERPDTGVCDVTFSTSASAPTLPANYTKYRYLFPMRTNGSGQWVGFTYDESDNLFRLTASVLDVNTSGPGTGAVTATLASVPTGVNVFALFNYGAYDATNANQIFPYFSDLAVTDEAPSATVAPLASSVAAASNSTGGMGTQTIRTNTSAQIRYRLNLSSGTTVVKIATLGWKFKMGGR